jgi:ABC-type transporter Mla MlaB component
MPGVGCRIVGVRLRFGVDARGRATRGLIVIGPQRSVDPLARITHEGGDQRLAGRGETLRIDVTPTRDGTTLRLEGPLTTRSASGVRAAARRLRPGAHLHVDLLSVSDLDAPGLGSLLGVIRRALEQRANVSMSAAGPLLGRLRADGIGQLVEVVPAGAQRTPRTRGRPDRSKPLGPRRRYPEPDPAVLW